MKSVTIKRSTEEGGATVTYATNAKQEGFFVMDGGAYKQLVDTASAKFTDKAQFIARLKRINPGCKILDALGW